MELKQSGSCPKCDSTSIWNSAHVQFPGSTKYYTHQLVRFAKKGRLRWDVRFAREVVYICIDCGYKETFIDNEGLETIREFGAPEER